MSNHKDENKNNLFTEYYYGSCPIFNPTLVQTKKWNVCIYKMF